ncbi:MAG: phosphotransferase family protein, partial [Bryobacteraceae bacterium]
MTDPVAYLRSRGVEAIRATELGGGVSNRVWLVETPRERLVLKQALGRLRVEEEWLSDRARVFRESAALKALAPCLPAGSVPLVLFEDAREFAFAMTAAGPESANWKDLLLAGDAREDTAETVGRLLARIATATWEKPDWEREFRDQTVFHQLRVDPYYRFTAARHPAQASHFERVMAESSARRVCLVHGDWSPKNFLV